MTKWNTPSAFCCACAFWLFGWAAVSKTRERAAQPARMSGARRTWPSIVGSSVARVGAASGGGATRMDAPVAADDKPAEIIDEHSLREWFEYGFKRLEGRLRDEARMDEIDRIRKLREDEDDGDE